ncbi:MAG TPA: exodeoxyribonuclease VII small subunit [Thermomicrobiales bacterium]|nr:exodeoxyribonuclease VII small subunit [Thermomicrobiales bacterium]
MTEHSDIEASLARLDALANASDFEAVHAGLSEAVRLLESPGIGLNQSIRAYEVGRTLADRAQALLDAAELRIAQLDSNDADAPG